MEVINMGKWQFIMDVCEMNGLKKSYELAREIRDALIELYEDEEVEVWSQVEKYWREVMSEVKWRKRVAILLLNEVITIGTYCKGCVVTDGPCEKCEFGKKYGICETKDSLYRKFYLMWKEENGIRAGEHWEMEFWTREIADLIESGSKEWRSHLR